MKTNGFTLIEILIATVIMAFISIFTAHMISEGVHSRAKIESDIDRTTELHDALSLMQQDIDKAFNYQDISAELYNQAELDRGAPSSNIATNPSTPTTPPATPTNSATQYPTEQEKIYTQFVGDHDTLNFDSLNNFRSARDEQQSDQCEIGYYIASCTSLEHPDESIQCLWRRVSPYIDSNVKEGGHRTPVLEDVKSLKFRYLGYGHEDAWVDSWDNVNGESVMKGRLPMAVEVTVSIYDRRFHPAKSVAMTIVAMPYFMNDPPNNQNLNGQTPTQPGQTTAPANPATGASPNSFPGF